MPLLSGLIKTIGAGYQGYGADKSRIATEAMQANQLARQQKQDAIAELIAKRQADRPDLIASLFPKAKAGDVNAQGQLIGEDAAKVGDFAAPKPDEPDYRIENGQRINVKTNTAEPVAGYVAPPKDVGNVTGPGGVRTPDVPGAVVAMPAAAGAPNARQRATYKAQKLTLDNLKDAITTYRAHLTGAGVEVLPGGKKSSLEATHANLILQAKEAAKLGVLAGPDMGILEKLVNDPTSMKSALLNVATLGGRAGAMKGQLDTFESIIDGYRTRLDETYGGNDAELPVTTGAKKTPTYEEWLAGKKGG